MKKKTDYWTEYEKQVAEWFASGDCNSAEKTKQACKEQKALWRSQYGKFEIVGNEWDPWNVAGIPWESWNNLNMENMEPDTRKRLVETMSQRAASLKAQGFPARYLYETMVNDPDWISFKNRLRQFRCY